MIGAHYICVNRNSNFKLTLRRVYRYIPNQKWDSESILYTFWWDKNLKNSKHSEGAENIDFRY